MIGTRQNVADFIDRIAAAADRRMKADYASSPGAAPERRAGRDASSTRGTARYYQEKVKAEQYNFDSQSVRPYFEYSRVKAGRARHHGPDVRHHATARSATPRCGTRTSRSTTCSRATTLLGRIYLDMFPRDNKYKHYAQFTLTNGKQGRMLPEGVLVCNFPKPGAEPALMQHSDVETFFHEFGHLLHHVLGGHTHWAGIAGVATEWDFVEAPSQMLEEWVWAPDTLQTFAKHYKTGEPIPADLVKRMRAADEFGKGLFVRQQMFYASISLQLHSRDPKTLDMPKVVAELQEKIDAVQVRRRHVLRGVVHAPERLFGDLLHLHVVAGHRQGHVHGVQPATACSIERRRATLPQARARAGRFGSRRPTS